VNSDGTFQTNFGFASVAHLGAGVYRLTLSSPPTPITNAIPVASVNDNLGIAFPNVNTLQVTIDVRTVPSANFGTAVTADLPFYIHVAA
jgi:hypothetical protein